MISGFTKLNSDISIVNLNLISSITNLNNTSNLNAYALNTHVISGFTFIKDNYYDKTTTNSLLLLKSNQSDFISSNTFLTSTLNNTNLDLSNFKNFQNNKNNLFASDLLNYQQQTETNFITLPELFYTKEETDALYLSSSLYGTFQPRIHNTAVLPAISLFNESTNKIKTITLTNGITTYNSNDITYQNDYLKMIEYTDSILLDLKLDYFSNLYYNKIQSDALYLSSSLYGSFQKTLTNSSNISMSLLNETTSKIKNLSLLSGITSYTTNSIIHENGYLSYSEFSDTITLDLKSDYRHTVTSLSSMFATKSSLTTLDNKVNIDYFNAISAITMFATKSSLATLDNKLNLDYFNNISATTMFQPKTGMSSYQPLLTNGSNATGAYMLYNNKIKNLSVLNGVNNLNLGTGEIIHSNTYLSVIESSDNTNITIDIDSTYLNTTTTLSNLYYRQSTMNSILTTNYQPLISTNSILSLNKINLGNASGASMLTVKGVNGVNPALILSSGSATTPAASVFYIGTYSDVVINPGNWGGGVQVFNLCTYPFINANTPVVSTALTPAVLKALVVKQATNGAPAGTNYALDITSVQTALSGLTFVVNGQRCISVDGVLALLVATVQNIYANLKTAGIAGFTTY
jgi:hypothetical protein